MKTKLYYSGVFACIFLLIGCIFKILHWPGANSLLIAGILFYILIYLPFAMLNGLKGEKVTGNKMLYLIAYLVIGFNFVSALFKIMRWPGSDILLVIAIPLPFVLFLPVYLSVNRNENQINYRNFIPIMFFAAYFAAISALLSLSPAKNIIDEMVKTTDQFQLKTTAYKSQVSYLEAVIAEKHDSAGQKVKIPTLFVSTEKALKLIDALKRDIMVATNESNSQNVNSKNEIEFEKLKGKESVVPMNVKKDKLVQLKGLLSQIKLQADNWNTSGTTKGYDLMSELTRLDDPEWENHLFEGKSLIENLLMLGKIEFWILAIEAESYNEVI